MVLGVLGGVLLFLSYVLTVRADHSIYYSVPQTEKPITNPLKGWAPMTQEIQLADEVTLAFMLVKWSDFNPQKGVYDFEKLEADHHLQEWREKNVRVIIRIVSDYPDLTNSENITIPMWLYEEIKGDGIWYHNSYGYGFSPNYANEKVIEAHQEMIAALGKRYNQDELIAFIQLGSLGHWGEWHVSKEVGSKIPFPYSQITNQYIKHYTEYFSSKKLLMRRPYGIQNDQVGLYHDVFGDQVATQEWLSWIESGYVSSQNGESMPAMSKDFWLNAPVGGEIVFSEDMEAYLIKNGEALHNQLIQSHATFIGPNAPVYVEQNSTAHQKANEILQDLGYCLTVRETELFYLNQSNQEILLKMKWENIGVAPIYQNWPVQITVIDDKGQVQAACYLEEDITTWGPGEHRVEVVLSHSNKFNSGQYRICVAILDPITRKPSINLPIQEVFGSRVYVIGHFQVE